MTDRNDGQSGRKPGDDRAIRVALHWRDIPADALWIPLSGFCSSRRLSFRKVGTMTGLAAETVRKIATRLSIPEARTRQILGELLLAEFPGGITVEGNVVQPKDDEQKWKLRERLIELLPEGESAARDEIARLFDLARRSPDAPAWLDEVEHWLDLQVRGEYWHEREWGPLRRREARGGKIKPGDEPKW